MPIRGGEGTENKNKHSSLSSIKTLKIKKLTQKARNASNSGNLMTTLKMKRTRSLKNVGTHDIGETVSPERTCARVMPLSLERFASAAQGQSSGNPRPTRGRVVEAGGLASWPFCMRRRLNGEVRAMSSDRAQGEADVDG